MTATTPPAGQLMLKNVRLAFPNLFEPRAIGTEPGAKPRFSAMLILPTDHPQLDQLRSAMVAVAKEKWGAKAAEVFKGLEKGDKLALHDGDTKAQYDGVAGNLFVQASSAEGSAPIVIDANKSPLTARSGKPYAGCYVNVAITVWAQDNNFGRRINAQLRGIQFLRDGPAFGAGRAADSDEFDDVSEGADAEEFA